MSGAHYVFAGGGTGGHLLPGLAVANALCTLSPHAQVTFFTTTRPLDRQLLTPTPYAQVEQSVQPFPSNPLRLGSAWWAWRQSVRAARLHFQHHRPAAVLGLGGYAAGPAVVAARALQIRAAILNPDAIPGRANRFLARYADLVVLQWDVARKRLPASAMCQTWGCPIRAEFATADGLEGRRRFELDADRPVLLVTGASQGARTVNRAVTRVWPTFWNDHQQWQLLHLSGAADEDEVRRAYAAAGVPAVVRAFTSEMAAALAAADLVISRAGASTLAELTVLGKPSILLPYPFHRDRHQHANARVLAERGAAIILEDRRTPDANERPLRDALQEAAQSDVRTRMAAAAQTLAQPAAATAVAEWLLE